MPYIKLKIGSPWCCPSRTQTGARLARAYKLGGKNALSNVASPREAQAGSSCVPSVRLEQWRRWQHPERQRSQRQRPLCRTRKVCGRSLKTPWAGMEGRCRHLSGHPLVPRARSVLKKKAVVVDNLPKSVRQMQAQRGRRGQGTVRLVHCPLHRYLRGVSRKRSARCR